MAVIEATSTNWARFVPSPHDSSSNEEFLQKKKKKFHLCNLEALLIAGPCFTQSNVNRLVKNTWGDSMQRNMDQYKSVDRSNLAQYSNLSQSIKLTPTLRRMSAYNFVFHNLLTSYRKLTASAIRKTEFCKRQIIQISFSELVRV